MDNLNILQKPFQITNGKTWALINCLCVFTAVMSSFLDNVTTVLLMTPVTIRLCEVMGLNPVPILMSMVIYSNIGGTLTPVGGKLLLFYQSCNILLNLHLIPPSQIPQM